MTFDHSLHVFRSSKFRSVVEEAIQFFTCTPIRLLPPPDRFVGSGVYALYYSGRFELYGRLSRLNREDLVQPIYVGKAVPPGWRTARAQDEESPDLFRRLREHTRSIEQAINLQAEDFHCRFMILGGIEGDLVVPVEAELIRRFRPLWNTVVDGFGNHDPGSGRYNQARSEWDILHPGRSWAKRLTGKSPRVQDVGAQVRDFLETLSLS